MSALRQVVAPHGGPREALLVAQVAALIAAFERHAPTADDHERARRMLQRAGVLERGDDKKIDVASLIG